MKNKTILIVEDDAINAELLVEILQDDFAVQTVDNGNTAIEMIHNNIDKIAVILLDLYLPGKNGFEILKNLQENKILSKIPVIVSSASTDGQTIRKCFHYEIFDFIEKPYNSILIKMRVKNAFDMFSYKINLEHQLIEQASKLQASYEKLKKRNNETIELLGSIVESRNLEKGSHIKRVKKYTEILATDLMFNDVDNKYKLSKKLISDIATASVLHDIGKLLIPESILLKPGKLTSEEFEKMKLHTIYGANLTASIVKVIGKKYEILLTNITKYHHEKWDGKGYPEGLKENEIPIEAQIVSLADCFDALTNERCYKKAIAPAKAYKMILDGECGQFSPDLINCFCRCIPKLMDILNMQKEED